MGNSISHKLDKTIKSYLLCHDAEKSDKLFSQIEQIMSEHRNEIDINRLGSLIGIRYGMILHDSFWSKGYCANNVRKILDWAQEHKFDFNLMYSYNMYNDPLHSAIRYFNNHQRDQNLVDMYCMTLDYGFDNYSFNLHIGHDSTFKVIEYCLATFTKKRQPITKEINSGYLTNIFWEIDQTYPVNYIEAMDRGLIWKDPNIDYYLDESNSYIISVLKANHYQLTYLDNIFAIKIPRKFDRFMYKLANTLTEPQNSENIQDRLEKINSQDRRGNTLLHYFAAKTKDIHIIKELLKHGADPSIKNKSNQTPFDLATHGGIMYLLKDTNLMQMEQLVDQNQKQKELINKLITEGAFKPGGIGYQLVLHDFEQKKEDHLT